MNLDKQNALFAIQNIQDIKRQKLDIIYETSNYHSGVQVCISVTILQFQPRNIVF